MIKSIYLENWKTHKDSFLTFNKGTNILIGKIGSGKSSIVDAICYCLFGTFPSLSSKKITISETLMFKPTKQEKAILKLEFTHADKTYLVERTIGKLTQAKLYLDGKLIAGPKQTDVNDRISQILNIDYALFSKIVYSEQNELDFFLKIPPSKRKEKFDELFGISHFENMKENVRKLISFVSIEQDKQQVLLNQLSSQILNINISELTSKELELKSKLEEVMDLLKNISEEKSKLIVELNIQKQNKEKFDKLNLQINVLSSKIDEITRQLDILKAKENFFFTYSLMDLEKLKKDKQKFIFDIQLEKENINSNLLFYTKQISDQESKINMFKRSIHPLQITTSDLVSQKEVFEKELLDCKAKDLDVVNMLNNIEKSISELQKGYSVCPICESPLTPDKIQEQLQKKQFQKQELLNKQKQLDVLKQQLSEKLSQLSLLEKNLKENELINSQISQLSVSLENNKKVVEDLSIKLKELEKNKVLNLEEELHAIDDAISFLSLSSQLNELSKTKNQLNEELSKLFFDENKYQLVFSEYQNIDLKNKNLLEQKKLYDSLLSSISKDITNYNMLVSSMQNVQKNIDKFNVKKQDLSYFLVSIEKSQVQLRNVLIDNINSTLSIIWPKLYAYGDYVS
ncbi:MAG TPA: SMC family ATPase, partial [archaeon]|nr:SMC family ATPase [archaeon]